MTGATGFIGSYIARSILAAQSGALRLLVRNISNYRGPSGSEVVQGDLMSRADCDRFVAGLKVIYYLAHTNSPVSSDIDLPSDALVNLVPLLNLVQAIQTERTKPHIVYFSSGGAVYEPKMNQIPYRETDPCNPVSSYGIQKLAAEQYLRLGARKGCLTATVLRIGNVYGTLLSQSRMQGFIGVALNSVVHGSPIRVFGNPENVRDYVHLDDLSDMVLRASVPTQPFTIVNVGCGVGYSVREILNAMRDVWGNPLVVGCDPSRGNSLTDWVVLDNHKALNEFGWSPRISLHHGIARMLDGLGRSQSAS